jgi:hypothetical protein
VTRYSRPKHRSATFRKRAAAVLLHPNVKRECSRRPRISTARDGRSGNPNVRFDMAGARLLAGWVAFRTRLFEPGLDDLTVALGRHRLAWLDVRHVKELIAEPQ